MSSKEWHRKIEGLRRAYGVGLRQAWDLAAERTEIARATLALGPLRVHYVKDTGWHLDNRLVASVTIVREWQNMGGRSNG